MKSFILRIVFFIIIHKIRLPFLKTIWVSVSLLPSDEVRTEVGGKECLDEKHDSDKDEDESDSHNEESQGRLVIDMDCPPPRLDYTDMDAVD